MTDAELADKLELHNRWRRGEFDKMPLSPKELGEVLDEVIRRLRETHRMEEAMGKAREWLMHKQLEMAKKRWSRKK